MTGFIHLSNNEVKTLTRKAGKGAGLSWGEADELGHMVAFLASLGFFPAQEIIDFLTHHHQLSLPILTKTKDERQDKWCFSPKIPTQKISPLALVCYLNDCQFHARPCDLSIKSLAFPALLLPVLLEANHLNGLEANMVLSPKTPMIALKERLNEAIKNSFSSLMQLDELIVIFNENHSVYPIAGAKPQIASLPLSLYKALDEFAQNMLAPATSISRLTGAGAGTHDHD